MEISYYGHSCFKLKGSAGTVLTDPFEASVGFALPTVSADLVTVSHQHSDHSAAKLVSGTARRDKPFVIDQAGEYEVGGISVFGVSTFHDPTGGVERGRNLVFTILIDGIRVCHLGDLGHELTQDQLSEIGSVDVAIVPVGGTFTIDPSLATKTIHMLEPAIAIPMHYNTPAHDQKVYGELATIADFLQAFGSETKPVGKLTLEASRLPEETELVVLASL